MSGVQLIDATLRIVELERENAALKSMLEGIAKEMDTQENNAALHQFMQELYAARKEAQP